jgi:mono/diheme cytochrome c family protein
MITRCLFLLIFIVLGLAAAFPIRLTPPLDEQTPVAEALRLLGAPPPAHLPNLSIPGVSAQAGEDLVLYGVARKPGGGATRKQSKHFVCTACHNVQRDEPTLRFDDPQARLEYVKEKGLPYLPGSSLYGVVNRETFYNGDYEKKYGQLVEIARRDLREAIQICAVECSQGRPLNDWEMESVLAYLWTIDLKLADLDLDQAGKARIEAALAGRADKDKAIELIRSRYAAAAPATFADPPSDRRAGAPVAKRDPANGKLLFELSCLFCHEDRRFAFFRLDDSQFSHQFLEKHFPRYTRYSTYHVARYGTSPIPGKRTYMPNYTLEKMSVQQLEDLRVYIEWRAGGETTMNP